jgi:serine phosphatase RsbU (regulator of sigma subunit)
VQLGPTDRLLLYSDGLVERRTTELDERLEQLRATARLEGGDAAALVDRLVATLAPTGADDVTVLALGLR